ncbi:hypothetical protein I5M27_01255 [Adhaeribacter sp. BT258]|uniref:YD repeat-containing protein n=1 Tax=Adhaeribacter terrigena TaxID=2793070 RepID=A0ABS1BWS5_9BACT|nr:hypothetical protein [Adhaeribacter terrigena]MBK0401590.1 hypothetical protein [Adhaeribacter terrigena]
MKKVLPVLFLAFAFLSCEKEKPAPIPEPELVFFPTEITRTTSLSPDVVKLKYTYNAANQLIKEEIFGNGALERYSVFSYLADGKLHRKRIYGSTGVFLEQDEMVYNGGNLPQKLLHSYPDAAGAPNLHHQRLYFFDANGNITRWTELAPDNQLTNSRTYVYKSNNAVTSTGTGDQGQFQDIIEISFDGKMNPFANTNINPITFAGNELKMELKDEAGRVVSSYTNTYDYNEKGFPVKRTQTLSNGTVKTETYVYKAE